MGWITRGWIRWFRNDPLGRVGTTLAACRVAEERVVAIALREEGRIPAEAVALLSGELAPRSAAVAKALEALGPWSRRLAAAAPARMRAISLPVTYVLIGLVIAA